VALALGVGLVAVLLGGALGGSARLLGGTAMGLNVEWEERFLARGTSLMAGLLGGALGGSASLLGGALGGSRGLAGSELLDENGGRNLLRRLQASEARIEDTELSRCATGVAAPSTAPSSSPLSPSSPPLSSSRARSENGDQSELLGHKVRLRAIAAQSVAAP